MCSFFFEEWNCLRTGKRQKRRINNLNFLRHFLKLDKSNWRVASPEIVCFHCIWYSSIRFCKLSGVWEGVWDDNYFCFCTWPSFSFTKMNSSKWNFESEEEKFIGGTWLKFFLPTFEMEWRNATFTLDDVACYQLFNLYSACILFLRLFSTLISCMTNYSFILARNFSVNV